MVFGLLKRLFGLAGLLLVAWAAVKVPIGRRTAWGHLVAIFTTEPAREAAEDIENIAVGSVKGLGHPEMHPDPSDKGRPPSEPSQGPAPRGKTPAPGSTHVRSAQQGVSPGS
jgi:hypothetical protein